VFSGEGPDGYKTKNPARGRVNAQQSTLHLEGWGRLRSGLDVGIALHLKDGQLGHAAFDDVGLGKVV